MGEKKRVEIIYFYSDLYENKKSLMSLVRKLKERRKDISIRLVNIEDPGNTQLTELYDVNSVPLMIFLTHEGEVASRKSIPLSDENTINDIADRIVRGDLPKPCVDNLRRKVLDSLKSVSQRNELTQLIVEQIKNDILEADSEAEIHTIINLHISIINHLVRDLEDYKKVLQTYIKRDQTFIV